MRSLLVALAAVALAGCAHAPAGEPRAALAAALDDAMDRRAASLPADRGLAFRVEAPRIDLVWAQARGEDIRPDQTVRIASITKTFVAAATLRLVERGQLRLDEPIQPLLSAPIAARLAADGYELRRITVRMLLAHTAGLFDYAEHPDYQARVGSDPSHVWTREEQIAFAVDHGDPLSAPGVAFAYSDTGYLLLGDILERVTGTPMAEAVRTLLEFQGHTLSHTWFESLEPEPASAPPRAPQAVGSLSVGSIHPSADLFGGGGGVSTPADLARFFRLLLRGEVLRPDTVRAMTAPTPQSLAADAGGLAAGGGGYGMGLAHETIDGVDCFGHGGFWGVVAWYCPEADLAVAGFVSNTDQRAALAALRDEALRLGVNAAPHVE